MESDRQADLFEGSSERGKDRGIQAEKVALPLRRLYNGGCGIDWGRTVPLGTFFK